MALTEPALPFGLRKVVLYPLLADGTRGTGVRLPVARTFSFTDTEDFQDLAGDDQTAASHGSGPTVDWELEAGGISYDAYKVIAGGTTATTGVTPASIKSFTKKTTDSRPYFDVEGQAISDSGGDMHCVVYRCKATGDIEGSFANGAFSTTHCTGKGYGATIGATPTNNLYVFTHNETVTDIV